MKSISKETKAIANDILKGKFDGDITPEGLDVSDAYARATYGDCMTKAEQSFVNKAVKQRINELIAVYELDKEAVSENGGTAYHPFTGEEYTVEVE